MVAKLENISLILNGQKILSGIDLELQKGQITTLIGPNGGGKTSIARILLGILKPTSGKVVRTCLESRCDEVDSVVGENRSGGVFRHTSSSGSAADHARRPSADRDSKQVLKNSGLKIGYMPQKIEIDRTIPLSAKDFIRLSKHKIIFGESLKILASRLNVEKILDHQIHDLSGGQMQKISFLRALAGSPDLLVLDEPTQCLDIAAIQDFYRIIDEVRKANDCTILLISHDLHTVMQKTDLVFCVNHHICCHGSPESVHQHPEYLSLFGQKSTLAIYQHHHDHKH